MKRSRLFSLVLVLAGLAMIMTFGVSAFAATTANQGLSFTNNSVADISLVGDGTVSFGTTNPGDTITRGDGTTPAAKLTVVDNGNWGVTLTGTGFTGPQSLPLADCFSVQIGSGSFAALSGAMTIAAAGQLPGTATYNVNYQLIVPANAMAGVYNASLTYTLATV